MRQTGVWTTTFNRAIIHVSNLSQHLQIRQALPSSITRERESNGRKFQGGSLTCGLAAHVSPGLAVYSDTDIQHT